jgi:hypothetical protein
MHSSAAIYLFTTAKTQIAHLECRYIKETINTLNVKWRIKPDQFKYNIQHNKKGANIANFAWRSFYIAGTSRFRVNDAKKQMIQSSVSSDWLAMCDFQRLRNWFARFQNVSRFHKWYLMIFIGDFLLFRHTCVISNEEITISLVKLFGK